MRGGNLPVAVAVPEATRAAHVTNAQEGNARVAASPCRTAGTPLVPREPAAATPLTIRAPASWAQTPTNVWPVPSAELAARQPGAVDAYNNDSSLGPAGESAAADFADGAHVQGPANTAMRATSAGRLPPRTNSAVLSTMPLFPEPGDLLPQPDVATMAWSAAALEQEEERGMGEPFAMERSVGGWRGARTGDEPGGGTSPPAAASSQGSTASLSGSVFSEPQAASPGGTAEASPEASPEGARAEAPGDEAAGQAFKSRMHLANWSERQRAQHRHVRAWLVSRALATSVSNLQQTQARVLARDIDKHILTPAATSSPLETLPGPEDRLALMVPYMEFLERDAQKDLLLRVEEGKLRGQDSKQAEATARACLGQLEREIVARLTSISEPRPCQPRRSPSVTAGASEPGRLLRASRRQIANDIASTVGSATSKSRGSAKTERP